MPRPTMQYAKSPEETGLYTCKRCGNRERFHGTDHNGTAGEIDCDDCERRGLDFCECPTILYQDFRVDPDDSDEERQVTDDRGIHINVNIDYDSHEGGGSGAEIGSYTRIECAECYALLWQDTDEIARLHPDIGAQYDAPSPITATEA